MKSKEDCFRIFAAILSLVILIGVLGSCSSDEKPEETTSKPEETTSKTEDSKPTGALHIEGGEDVTLTYWIPMEGIQAQEFASLAEHPYYIWFEEETGVTIEFIHPTWEQTESQLTMMISSGNFYDMLYGPWYPGGPQTAIDEEAFIDLNPYLDKYMPDYKAAMMTSDGSFADWEWGPEKELYELTPQRAFHSTLLTSSGALWSVSQVWGTEYPTEVGGVIRKDWLDEAGLDIPVTLDEYETVLEAFKQRGDDIIPMNLGAGGSNSGDGSFVSAFDHYADFFTMNADNTEVLPHAYTQESFKDYLVLMNDWYSKGYIDPDFMNRDGDALAALFMDDRLGIYFDQYYTPAYWEDSYLGEQDIEIVALPLPRKTEDQQVKWKNFYGAQPINNTVITTSCEYPEIAAQWLNAAYTKEAILRQSYGVEGVDYELVDGAPYFLDSAYEQDFDTFRMNYLSPNFTNYHSIRSIYLLKDKDATTTPSEQAETFITWGRDATADLTWGYLVFEGDSWGVFENHLNDALTYAQPMVLKFIIGEESLDKFEEFRSNAETMGLEDARKVAQENMD